MTRLLTTRARPLELGAGGLSTIICDDSTSRARKVVIILALATGCSLQTTTEGMAGALACGWEQRADVTTPADYACWEPLEPGVAITPGWADACDVTDNQLDSVGPGEHVRLWTRLSDRSDHDEISMKACEK